MIDITVEYNAFDFLQLFKQMMKKTEKAMMLYPGRTNLEIYSIIFAIFFLLFVLLSQG